MPFSRVRILLSAFAILALAAGCTRKESHSTLSFQTPRQLLSRSVGAMGTAVPPDRAACYGINIKGAASVSAANSCSPPTGILSGYVGAGQSLYASVPKGKVISIDVYVYLKPSGNTDACPSLTAAFDPNQNANVYLVGSASGISVDQDDTVVDITADFPGLSQNIAQQLSMPAVCLPTLSPTPTPPPTATPTPTPTPTPTALSVSGPSSVTAGTCSAAFTVTATDGVSPTNVAASTTVSLSGGGGGGFYSNATCSTSVSSVTIVTGSNSAVFFFKDIVAQNPTLTASAVGLTPATANPTVNPGSIAGFIVNGVPNPVIAGTSAPITVVAQDAYGNVKTDYTGSIDFVSDDAAATLPSSFSFSPGDLGVLSYPSGLIFKTTGSHYIKARDISDVSKYGQQSSIQVNPGPIASFTVSGITTPTTAGAVTSPSVAARDAYGNLKTDYLGTIHFMSDDGSATLPANYTFTAGDAGVHSFVTAVTLKTSGTHFVKAEDVSNASYYGLQNSIFVNPGAPSGLVFSVQPFDASPHTGINWSQPPEVTFHDVYGNVAATAAGVSLSAYTDSACTSAGSGSLGVLSASTFAGVATFTGVSYSAPEIIYVKATSGGVTSACSSSPLNVQASTTLVSIAIGPGVDHIPNGGATLQLQAIGTFSDNSTADITNSVSWSTSNPSIGTMNTTGLLTSNASAGIVRVQAYLTGVSAFFPVQVVGMVTGISLPNSPNSAVYRPNSHEVWVSSAAGQAIYVIDTLTNSVASTIALSTHFPGQIAFLPDGSKAYVLVTGGMYGVDIINAVTKSVIMGVSISSNYGGGIAVKSDGTDVLVVWQTPASITSISPFTDATTTYSGTPTNCPTSAAFIPDSPMFYLSSQCYGPDAFGLYNYPATTPTVFQAPSNYTAGAIYATPDSRWILAGNGYSGANNSFAIPAGSNSTIQVQTVGTPWGSMGFLPDNRRMVWQLTGSYGVFDYGGNSISSQLDNISVIPAGQDPAITPQATMYLPTTGNTIVVYQYSMHTAVPSLLHYPWKTADLTVGVPMEPAKPKNEGGAILSYSIVPALPTGLTLNGTTGIISGTPSGSSAQTIYTVTGTNASGSIATNLKLSVSGSDSFRAWSATQNLPISLSGSAVMALPNGSVLIAGGQDSSTASLSSSMIYTPGAGYSPGPSMTVARASLMTTTALKDGKFLIAGGASATVLSSAEIYDPANGIFTATSNMTVARFAHTATLLPDGRVLIAGGKDNLGNILASAEIYNPGTGAFTSTTGNMTTARDNHTATLLPNGQVLIAGGCLSDAACSSSALSSAETFDPATGTFTATSNSMSSARRGHSALMLSNGKVLLASGAVNDSGTYTTSADLYDPAARTFSATSSLSTARANFVSAILPNGEVVLAGGAQNGCPAVATTELYNPQTGTFSNTQNMVTGVAGASSTMLPNGGFFVMGGGGNTCSFSTTNLAATYQ